MVELSPSAASGTSPVDYRMGFAGDTFNTVVSLARLGVSAAYVTRLGDDPFSDQILALMKDENVNDSLVERVRGRQPGLYVIANAPDGERSFHYWRAESPARELWSQDGAAERVEQALADYSHIYLSGITLAIMAPGARARLHQFLTSYRQRGGQVVFDSNYRHRLWPDIGEARREIGALLGLADLALLTLEDEQALWSEASAERIVARHRQAGVSELVIKQGAGPVILCADDRVTRVDVPKVEDIVDTTGAGDAFNAGYLARRLNGDAPGEAVHWGSQAAAAVIRRRGGIVPRSWFLQAMTGIGD